MNSYFTQHLITGALAFVLRTGFTTCAVILGILAPATRCFAQAAGDLPSLSPTSAAIDTPATSRDEAAELAKKLNNPVANLISVPFQFNYDEGFGPKDSERITLNVQPVIPVPLNKDWNLITRTIVPVVYQDSIADGVDSEFGLGDIVQSFFLSPKAPTSGGWIWGIGPAFLWPTATDNSLGSEKWGLGPTVVLLRQEHGLTYGVLANHIWSYAGDDDRKNVNATFIQPFISYTTTTHTTFGINTESTYDWTASDWTVPINLTVSQLLKIGKQPVQLSIGPRYYAASPDGGPEWGARFTVTFLFPQ
jgi:hypothetical protein